MLKNQSYDPCKLATAPQCCLPTFTHAACERIRDQPAFKMRLAHVHDRVMQDALGEARRRDDSLLRVTDHELLESADREAAVSQAFR